VALQNSVGSAGRRGSGISYVPKTVRRCRTVRIATGTRIPTSVGAQLSAMNAPGPSPIAGAASRFVRFETGSARDAVLASQTVARANGSGETPMLCASTTTTGVTITAVVSSERNTVLTTASTTTSAHSTTTRPRPQRARRCETTSNTAASRASSATIVIATTNPSTGAIRSPSAPASVRGRNPVSTHPSAATTSPATIPVPVPIRILLIPTS